MSQDRFVCGAWQSYLEQLYANDGEHELQEAGDEDYVSDSLYSYDDALYYVLGSTLIIMYIRSFTNGVTCADYNLLRRIPLFFSFFLFFLSFAFYFLPLFFSFPIVYVSRY